MRITVLLNSIILIFFTFVLLTGTCDDSGVTDPGSGDTTKTDPNDTTKTDPNECSLHGIFEITFKEFESPPTLIGAFKNGPTPSKVFETAETDGDCKLVVPTHPFCEDCNGVCVANDSCQPFPDQISSVGTVTVNGLKTADGATSFSMEPSVRGYYQAPGLAFDLFSEGDEITVSVGGTTAISPFSLDVKGICRLNVLNDTIWMRDGESIDLRWDPPNIPGISTIFVKIDISYHGGTKAKIECETEDDGELTIPAHLLDKLKVYGMAGFPEIEISRRATSTDECGGVKLVIIDKVAKYLEIPGVISCNGDGECPDGQTCIDRLCQ
ncbi:MAG TPA: hypothetical protein VKY57_08575 [Chitinispirillaceae bacterium]|nr:hypothetical protein [Chitinispirillaceae bacterium]